MFFLSHSRITFLEKVFYHEFVVKPTGLSIKIRRSGIIDNETTDR